LAGQAAAQNSYRCCEFEVIPRFYSLPVIHHFVRDDN